MKRIITNRAGAARTWTRRCTLPEMQTDGRRTRARAAGCTGEAQANNRQLVTANFMAASLAMMVTRWVLEYPALDVTVRPHLPYRLRCNLTSLETDKIGNKERTV